MTLRLTILSLLALTLPACGDGNKLTDSDTDANSTSAGTEASTDSTVGMSSSPTTGEVPVTATTTDGSDSQTSDVHTASSVSTTEDSAGSATTTEGPIETTSATSDSESTGEVDPQIAEHCASVCAKFIECKVMDDQDACTAECTENLGDEDPTCSEADLALLTCVEGMTCEQVTAFVMEEDPGPCADQLVAAEAACGGNECIGSVGTNEDNTECSISTECPDEPAQTMTCDLKTCTCTVGDMKTGECPAMNVCAAIEELEAKSQKCCGF